MSPNEIRSNVEAILFSAQEPISVKRLSQVFAVPAKPIRRELKNLSDYYRETDRSFELIEVAKGFQLSTLAKYDPWIEKFYTKKVKIKLSKAALETVAIIAHKQPITRSAVSEIRGVNSDGVIRSLLGKNLIRSLRRTENSGRAVELGTTDQFLMYFGLKNISELNRIVV